MHRNYYDILEVSKSASIETIKAAYRSLAKKYHADNGNDNDIQMAEINEAYEVLSDEKKKAKYDEMLMHGDEEGDCCEDDYNNGSEEVVVELFSENISFTRAELFSFQLHAIFVDSVVSPVIKKIVRKISDGASLKILDGQIKEMPLKGYENYFSMIKSEVTSALSNIAKKFNLDSRTALKLEMLLQWDTVENAYLELLDVLREKFVYIYEQYGTALNDKSTTSERQQYENMMKSGFFSSIYLDITTSLEESLKSHNLKPADKERYKAIDEFNETLTQILLAFVCIYEGGMRICMQEIIQMPLMEIDEVLKLCEMSTETIQNSKNKEAVVKAFRCNPFNSMVYQIMINEYFGYSVPLYNFVMDNNIIQYRDLGILQVTYVPSKQYRELDTNVNEYYTGCFVEMLDLILIEKVTKYLGTTDAKKISDNKLNNALDMVNEYCECYNKNESRFYKKMPYLYIAQGYSKERAGLTDRINAMSGKSLEETVQFVANEKAKNGEHIYGSFEKDFNELLNNAASSRLEENYKALDKQNLLLLKNWREDIQNEFGNYPCVRAFVQKVTEDIFNIQDKQVELELDNLGDKKCVDVINLLYNIRTQMEMAVYTKYEEKFQNIIEEKAKLEIIELYDNVDKEDISSLQELLLLLRRQYKNYKYSVEYIHKIESHILVIKERELKADIEQLYSKTSKEIRIFLNQLSKEDKSLSQKYMPKCKSMFFEKQKQELDILYSELDKSNIDKLFTYLKRLESDYKDYKEFDKYVVKIKNDIFVAQKLKLYAELGDVVNSSMNTKLAYELYKKIEKFECPEEIKNIAYDEVCMQLVENNAPVIEEIIDKLREGFPFISSDSSKVILYKKEVEESGMEFPMGLEKLVKGLLSAGIRLEQPIVSHLREGLLDMPSQLNGFAITQKSLLYFEKGIINKISLSDISDFLVQKKFMGTELFVTVVNGMSIKLAAKFPKEVVNNIPIILKETVKMIKESSIYVE